MKISLSKPQFQFVKTNSPFPAMVSGYGAGKTTASVYRLIRLKMENTAHNVAYYLPTYDLITQIAYPVISEALSDLQIPYTLNKADKVFDLTGCGKIILRTMDRPERIVGYQVADSVLDELDTLPTEKAADVWRKVVARNRQKKSTPNTIAVATTPEGFRFVYDRWKRNPMKGSELIQASTWSNYANLPSGYIQSLYDTYPENMLDAYIKGEFVNLTSGTVYKDFDRKRHLSTEKIQKNDHLHIGMDFNVGNMSAVTCVLRDNIPHAVDELTKYLDTPAMILAIKDRYPDHKIMVYPDASGKNRKSNNASETDISLLRQAGFVVYAHNKNPFVKNRVQSVNIKFSKNELYVNPDGCPELVDALEQQAYDKNGEPDKTSGHDHLNDCLGYLIFYRYPVTGNAVSKFNLKGV